MLKSKLIAFASAENIVETSGSLAENMSFLINEAVATLFLFKETNYVCFKTDYIFSNEKTERVEPLMYIYEWFFQAEWERDESCTIFLFSSFKLYDDVVQHTQPAFR